MSKARHPGVVIRDSYLPKGMTVVKAARLLGVSRPALSNLLNGNSSLSVEMAGRIEATFGIPASELIELQAKFDASVARAEMPSIPVSSYVPRFLQIRANQIQTWAADELNARARLPVLLRTLVHSTGGRLTEVTFHGNDDSQRPGYDGEVIAVDASPWVPAGHSVWEFGTNADPLAKANADFEKRLEREPASERAEMSFVFVTPRRWNGKQVWEDEKNALAEWKSVRAFDASDLEQWLENSLQGQVWMARELELPTEGVRTLDDCWRKWSEACKPALSAKFFDPAKQEAREDLLRKINGAGFEPAVISADSREEGLAFLATLLKDNEAVTDHVMVFDQPGIFEKLSASTKPFIAVTSSRDVEREFGPHMDRIQTILIYPRNSHIPTKVDLDLSSPGFEAFRAGLQDMGVADDLISHLASTTSRSLTVLRRRLAIAPALKHPNWLTDTALSKSLIPFFLIGAWDSTNSFDRDLLTKLAGNRDIEELERDCSVLTSLEDPPMWSIDRYRGIVSKLDVTHAVAPFLTRDDLRTFYDLAEKVLGEDDPALDLDEDQRWAASLHGKQRSYSQAVRNGMAETLVVLAVHGDNLIGARLGTTVSSGTGELVTRLLRAPLTARSLESKNRDLPVLAEVAPSRFLEILQNDLLRSDSAVAELMRPVKAGMFSSPVRTGLLWALEGLAWNVEYLPRAVIVLAQLGRYEIDDNWINKPINSLKSIFRSWMPQTSAPLDMRIQLLRKLVTDYPGVAWEVCMDQFATHQTGSASHKPTWRSDGYGFGQPLDEESEIREFRRAAMQMALEWEQYSVSMLSQLIERVEFMSEAEQATLWELIGNWGSSSANESEKAELREKIRTTVLSVRAVRRNSRSSDALASAAANAMNALEAKDVVLRHLWLFKNHWVDESAAEIDSIDDYDFRKREERINDLRLKALRNIVDARGADGVLQLGSHGAVNGVVGSLLRKAINDWDEFSDTFLSILSVAESARFDDARHLSLLASMLSSVTETEKLTALLNSGCKNLSPGDAPSLLKVAPFGKPTWSFLDGLSIDISSQYWRDVIPNFWRNEQDGVQIGVERLLKAKRPRAAFYHAKYDLATLDVDLLFALLSEILKGGEENAGEYLLDRYWLNEAFKRLDSSGHFTVEEMSFLELSFVDALSRKFNEDNAYGIPNLEEHISQHPEVFVHVIAWAYRRKDRRPDNAEFDIEEHRIDEFALRGLAVLDALQKIPGMNNKEDSRVAAMNAWIDAVRIRANDIDRAAVADVCIGQLLSNAPADADGTWPCRAVRDVLESLRSDDVMRGMHTGVYNSRGVHMRAPGGAQERELSQKYRSLASRIAISHPFVSSQLLLRLADTYEHEARREDSQDAMRRHLDI